MTQSSSFTQFSGLTAGIPSAVAESGLASREAKDCILRGLYCLTISGLEVYMSSLGVEYFTASMEAAAPIERPNQINIYMAVAAGCKIRGVKRDRYLQHGSKLRQEFYRDFSSIIINRPTIISLLADEMLSDAGGSAALWDSVALELSLRDASAARQSLDLAVERRNEIAHYGDYRRTYGQNPIQEEFVRTAYRLVSSTVAAIECRLPDFV